MPLAFPSSSARSNCARRRAATARAARNTLEKTAWHSTVERFVMLARAVGSGDARVVVRARRCVSWVAATVSRLRTDDETRRNTEGCPPTSDARRSRTRRDSRTTWIPPRRATRRTLRDNPRRDALPVIFPKPSVPGDERRFSFSPRVTRQTPAGISLVAVVLSHISVIFPRATNHDEAAPWSPSPSAPVSPSFLVIIASRTEMSTASDPSASMRSFS